MASGKKPALLYLWIHLWPAPQHSAAESAPLPASAIRNHLHRNGHSLPPAVPPLTSRAVRVPPRFHLPHGHPRGRCASRTPTRHPPAVPSPDRRVSPWLLAPRPPRQPLAPPPLAGGTFAGGGFRGELLIPSLHFSRCRIGHWRGPRCRGNPLRRYRRTRVIRGPVGPERGRDSHLISSMY